MHVVHLYGGLVRSAKHTLLQPRVNTFTTALEKPFRYGTFSKPVIAPLDWPSSSNHLEDVAICTPITMHTASLIQELPYEDFQRQALLGHPDCGHTHTGSNTHTAHTDLLAGTLQLVQQCANLSGAGTSEWMPKSYGATLGIDLLHR